jgi:hypothetical protein
MGQPDHKGGKAARPPRVVAGLHVGKIERLPGCKAVLCVCLRIQRSAGPFASIKVFEQNLRAVGWSKTKKGWRCDRCKTRRRKLH